MSKVIAILAVFLAGGGCYPEKAHSPTTGTLHVRIAESVAPPVIRQVEAFLDVYAVRGADIHYEVVTSVDAVHAFVRDSIQLSVTIDSLTGAETEIVDAMDGSFLVRTAAYDGVAVVTHPNNPVEVITTTQIRDLLSGTLTSWRAIGSSAVRGKIQVILQERSDISRYLERTVLAGGTITAGYQDVGLSRDVLSAVLANRNAIGFVGTAWLDSAGIRPHTPKVFMDHPTRSAWYDVAPEAAEFAYAPHPANILRGYYPLRRKVFLLSRAALGGDLATGFGAYILNSAGQRIFFDAGLIPATQTIRLN